MLVRCAYMHATGHMKSLKLSRRQQQVDEDEDEDEEEEEEDEDTRAEGSAA